MLVGCTADPATAGPTPVIDEQHEPGPTSEFVATRSVCREVIRDERSRCAVHWTQDCDEALLAAAYRKSEEPARTGACYYHDRTTCPDCACEYYLKVGKIGFDGGTGCLRSLEDVARELRSACAGQRCEP